MLAPPRPTGAQPPLTLSYTVSSPRRAATTRRGWARHVASVALLFSLACVLAWLIVLLQSQHRVTVVPIQTFPPAWVFVSCGLGAVLVAYALPVVDARVLDRPLAHDQVCGWPSLIRVLGVFLGMNYATAKLSFAYAAQLAVLLACVAVMLWYLFDRSPQGFVLGLVVAAGGTIAVRLIVSAGAYTFVKSDFIGIRSYIPGLFFAASVLFGGLGRRLVVYQGLHLSKSKPI